MLPVRVDCTKNNEHEVNRVEQMIKLVINPAHIIDHTQYYSVKYIGEILFVGTMSDVYAFVKLYELKTDGVVIFNTK